MIYFITYPDSQVHWQGLYNNTIVAGLEAVGLSCKKISLDFFSPDCHQVLREIQMIRSNAEDTWLLAWAQNPVIELIEHKPGRKFAHIHGLGCFTFEPSVLAGVDLDEHKRFGYYDRLFVNSQWSYDNAVASYPEHSKRFVITGFPMDYSVYDRYLNIAKDERLVVLNQRFALERAPTLVVELAERLHRKGYRVAQLSGEPQSLISGRNPDLGRLLKVGQKVGLEFVYNDNKEDYHKRLAAASVVITTSQCDNLPVSMLEAVYMGAVPVAPNAMCFPEFIHPDNLYTPYALGEIIDLVATRPVHQHQILQYDKSQVLPKYIAAMK